MRENFIFLDKHTESRCALSSVSIRIFFAPARAFLLLPFNHQKRNGVLATTTHRHAC